MMEDPKRKLRVREGNDERARARDARRHQRFVSRGIAENDFFACRCGSAYALRMISPGPELVLQEGDVIVLLGTPERLAAAEMRLLQG